MGPDFGHCQTRMGITIHANTTTHIVDFFFLLRLALFCFALRFALHVTKSSCAERHIISVSFQLCFNIHANKFNKLENTQNSELNPTRHTEHRHSAQHTAHTDTFDFISFLYFLFSSCRLLHLLLRLKTHTCNFFFFFLYSQYLYIYFSVNLSFLSPKTIHLP